MVLSENSSNGFRHLVSGITSVLDGCTIVSNVNGVSNVGGTIFGFGNNSIGFNGQDVVGNAVQTLMQP